MPKVTLDRIEEGVAVLILDGRELKRPRGDLPPQAPEGDGLDLETPQLDPLATEQLRARVLVEHPFAERTELLPLVSAVL